MSNRGLIIFKAKAWLDMRERSATGIQGLSKAIKKQLNDIKKIAPSTEMISDFTMPESVT